MSKRPRFVLWYTLVAVLILLGAQYMFSGKQAQRLQYSEFKQHIAAQKIVSCEIGPEKIEGILKLDDGTERPFVTHRVDDPGLVQQLQEQGIAFTGRTENVWVVTVMIWVIPLVLILIVWFFLIRRMGPGNRAFSFGRSPARLYMSAETGVTFADVAGMDEARAELEEVVAFLKTPERYQRLGGRIPKGVLLVGPPGTGKTLMAKAVAGEAKAPFFSISGSGFVELFVGVGASRVRDLFTQAQRHAPAIIFIDELDALGKARVGGGFGGHDEREQTLNQLLVELDGFDPRHGVILMAATNRPELLDPALLRPGRFDRQVLLDAPDGRGRLAILQVHARGVRLSGGLDLSVVAGRTVGFVGADLANVLNEAALLAARLGKESVELEDIEEAIDRVVGGLERRTRLLGSEERIRVAVHESGHALMAELVGGLPVHKVSIVPRGVGALGYTLQRAEEDRYVMTRGELLGRLQVLLGGRGAEFVVYGEVSTGAQNDLQRASDLARRMVRDYGMSDAIGPVTFDRENGRLMPDTSGATGSYSQQTAGAIDREVRRIIDKAYERVLAMLTEQKAVLGRVTAVLQEKEILEGEELRRIIREGKPVE